MDFLQSILDNTSIPAITAFILGILTAISPCPLATNITAIGFIGKDIENHHRIFINGLLYTLRPNNYLYDSWGYPYSHSPRRCKHVFRTKGCKQVWRNANCPAINSNWYLYARHLKLNLPKINFSGNNLKRKTKGSWGALFLGILFSLAFCPTSGIFYFGMLMPMSAAETGGYLLPVVYAIATGLPVILVAWVLAYSVAGLGKLYNRIQVFEKWFRKVVAILFIAVGIYYAVMYYL